MAEQMVSLLKEYKGSEYNVLRVSIMGANNSNQHLVIRINDNGEIKVIRCAYASITNVRAFLEREFPKTRIVER